MSTLYELTGQMLELYQMADDEDTDLKELADMVDILDCEIKDKADGYAKILKSLDAEAAAIESEVKRLSAKKTALADKEKYLKQNLQNSMQAIGKTKFNTTLFSFSIQKNPPSVVVDHESEIPEEFWVQQDPRLNKIELGKYLKEHKVGWAHLEQGESLRIR